MDRVMVGRVQDQTTAAHPVQVQTIKMNIPDYSNLKYLTGFLHYLNKHHIYLRSRSNGMVANFLSLCHQTTDGLEWTFASGNFPFNPKTIPRIKNRKTRKACYRCFAKYKRPLGAEKPRNVWGEVNEFVRCHKEEIKSHQYR